MVRTDRKPVALVTGAGSGIGLATVVALGRRGYRVAATIRSQPRADHVLEVAAEAGIDEVEVSELEVTSDASVADCVGRLAPGGIDVVVNSAGIGFTGSLEELSLEDLQRCLDVNFLGVARVTKAVLPVMRSAGRGHIISVSSIAGVFGQPFNDAYCAAKCAVEGLYESLWPVAAAFGVHVSLVEPGPVQGQFVEKSGGRTERHGDDILQPLRPLWERFERVATAGYAHAQTALEVAEVIADVASDPAPRLRYQTSAPVARLVGRKLADVTGEAVTAMTAGWLSQS